MFGALFARPIGSTGDLLGMATGESLAHLNCLLASNEAVVEADAADATNLWPFLALGAGLVVLAGGLFAIG